MARQKRVGKSKEGKTDKASTGLTAGHKDSAIPLAPQREEENAADETLKETTQNKASKSKDDTTQPKDQKEKSSTPAEKPRGDHPEGVAMLKRIIAKRLASPPIRPDWNKVFGGSPTTDKKKGAVDVKMDMVATDSDAREKESSKAIHFDKGSTESKTNIQEEVTVEKQDTTEDKEQSAAPEKATDKMDESVPPEKDADKMDEESTATEDSKEAEANLSKWPIPVETSNIQGLPLASQKDSAITVTQQEEDDLPEDKKANRPSASPEKEDTNSDEPIIHDEFSDNDEAADDRQDIEENQPSMFSEKAAAIDQGNIQPPPSPLPLLEDSSQPVAVTPTSKPILKKHP